MAAVTAVLLIVVPASAGANFFLFPRQYTGSSEFLDEIDIWKIPRGEESGISLRSDLGLNNATAALFDNDTLSLRMQETTTNTFFTYRYVVGGAEDPHAWIANSGPMIIIDPAAEGHYYHLSFRYMINSTLSDVQNITLMEPQNCFNLTFRVMENRTLEVNPDAGFEHSASRASASGIFATIWLLGDSLFNGSQDFRLKARYVTVVA